MSHIDAKAETKGVRKAYTKNGYFICRCGVVAMPLTDDTICDCGDLYEQEWNFVEVPAAPQPQRHARINCNGKSCGEFNCDTCHPQELPALSQDWKGLESVVEERECQLREALQEVKERDVALALACELHGCASKNCTADRYRADGEKLVAELATLKGTPRMVISDLRDTMITRDQGRRKK